MPTKEVFKNTTSHAAQFLKLDDEERLKNLHLQPGGEHKGRTMR